VAWADESGSRAYVSPQLQAMTGYSPSEWLAEPNMWVRRLHPEDREAVLRQFRDACATGGRFAAEYRLLDREGRVVWWRDDGRVLAGPDGKARFVRGFILDITEQRLAEESLRKMRFFDQLTGLPNRVMLLNRLGRALAEAVRTSRPLAVLILALDRFARSRAPSATTTATSSCASWRCGSGVARDADRVARLRGDEFGVLLPDADTTFARQWGSGSWARSTGRSWCRSCRSRSRPASGCGGAGARHRGGDAPPPRGRGGAAARRLGGAACVAYSSACELHDPARLALLGELRRALGGNELLLHYQPKVDLKTRRVVGAEALLRWPHPKRGFVPPGEFIPITEQTGLIRPLTRWVLHRAAEEARGWEREGRSSRWR